MGRKSRFTTEEKLYAINEYLKGKVSIKHPVGTELIFTNEFTNIAGKSMRKYGKN